MANYTKNLNLFKYDTVADSQVPFSINDALNQNWDILDEAFNNKADTDLTNVTDTGYIKMAGASMPSNRYVDLTLGASGSIYTAPANGWFALNKKGTATNQNISGIAAQLCYSTVCGATNRDTMISWAVKKGQDLKIWYTVDGITNYFRFIYAVGSESEAS